MENIDVLIEKLRNDFEGLHEVLNKFCAKKYESTFFDQNKLNEESAIQEQVFCRETAILIKRISKDISDFEKALQEKLKVVNIEESNNNLVDIAGTHKYIQMRYRRLRSKNDTLNNLYNTLEETMKKLNLYIIQYNKTVKNKIYTISEAMKVFEEESPSI